MSRPSYEPERLRSLASALRDEARVIERHNRGLKRLEADNYFFPVEMSANAERIQKLDDAADVLEALASRDGVAVKDDKPPA